MRPRRRLTVLTLLGPATANACGGGPDTVGIAILVALFVLMAPAFLIPLAGILALRPTRPNTYARLFAIYGCVGVGAAVSDVLTQPPEYVTVALIMLCAAFLLAPSIHYLLVSTRFLNRDRKT